MAEPKVEVVPSPFAVIGEGPHWDVDTQSLYYNDIYGKETSILRYDLKENRVYSAVVGKNILSFFLNCSSIQVNITSSLSILLTEGEPGVSFIIPVAGTKDQFAVGIGRRVGIVQWDGVSSNAKIVRIALEVEKGDSFKLNRLNDAKADPKGRFVGGTMKVEDDFYASTAASLYRLTKGEEVKVLKTNISLSNGLTWNEQKKKFYFIDSCQSDVKEFDYDPETGDICKKLTETATF